MQSINKGNNSFNKAHILCAELSGEGKKTKQNKQGNKQSLNCACGLIGNFKLNHVDKLKNFQEALNAIRKL